MRRPLLPEILLCQFYDLDDTDEEPKWRLIDIGYAYVNKQSSELVLYQKDSQQEVHKHEINFEINYIQCEDEVISFTLGHKDYAFSFQNQAGAETIWAKLQDVLQAQLKRQSTQKETFEEMKVTDEDISSGSVREHSLPKLLNYLMLSGQGNSAKTMLSNLMINKRKYLENLQKVFDQAELNQGDDPKLTLKYMCCVVKQIVIYADYELLQILMSDTYYQFMFGALEYDEEMQKKEFIPYRRYLQYHSCFVQVVEIRDKSKLQIIHFIYRLTYLRDCVLAYYIDEFQMMFFKIIIKNCYGEIINYIETSRDFLVQVVDEIRNYNFQALKFLHEILQVLKEYQDVNQFQIFLRQINRIMIYEKLNEFGLYEILEEYLKDFERGPPRYQSKVNIKKKTKLKQELLERIPSMCLEILGMSIQHQPNYLRSHVTSETQKVLKYPMFNQIIDNMMNCKDLGIQIHFCNILRGLLDSIEFEVNEVHELFFSQFQRLINQLDGESNETSLQFKCCFLEVCADLSRFIRPRVKEVFTQSNLMERFGEMLKQDQKFVNIKILQLSKTLLLSKDEDIQQSLIYCLPGLIQMFLQYKRKQENLIYAIMLQVIQTIYSVSSMTLQEALETKLQLCFNHPNFCRTLQTFKELKDRSKRNPQNQPTSLFSDAKLQETLKQNQFSGHRGEYDDIDLFSSSGMQIELERTKPIQTNLVDYDEDEEQIIKKVKTSD